LTIETYFLLIFSSRIETPRNEHVKKISTKNKFRRWPIETYFLLLFSSCIETLGNEHVKIYQQKISFETDQLKLNFLLIFFFVFQNTGKRTCKKYIHKKYLSITKQIRSCSFFMTTDDVEGYALEQITTLDYYRTWTNWPADTTLPNQQPIVVILDECFCTYSVCHTQETSFYGGHQRVTCHTSAFWRLKCHHDLHLHLLSDMKAWFRVWSCM
jgi:hypothetical protein